MKSNIAISAAVILVMTVSLANVQGLEERSQQEGAGYEEILRSLLPGNTEMKGWNITSGPQFFAPQNLWEHINGQAEMYLDYGFEGVVAAEYTAQDSPGSMMIEIYRMQSPRHAFGIYAAERSPHDRFIKTGVQGYVSENVLNFWKGLYYVKLTSFQTSPGTRETLMKLAGVIENKIEGACSEPGLFSVFPDTHRIKMSERFIPKNFLGLSFLKDGYRVEYEEEGDSYQLFLVKNASPDIAQDVFRKYHDFIRSHNESVFVSQKDDYQIVFTKRERASAVFQYGSFVGGVLNRADLSRSEELIKELIQKLKRVE